jgi:hypothetical protein
MEDEKNFEEENLEGLDQQQYDEMLDQIYQKYNLKPKENNSNPGLLIMKGDKLLTEKEKDKHFKTLGEGKTTKSEEITFIPFPKTEKNIAREKFHQQEEIEKEFEKKEKEEIIAQLRLNSKNIGNTKKKSNIVIFVPTNKKQKSQDSKPVTLQIRLLDSSTLNTVFQSEDNIEEVLDYILQTVTNDGNTINTDYTSGINLLILKKKYSLQELKSKTLKEVGLYPRGMVFVLKDLKGYHMKNEPSFIVYDKVIIPKYQLVGDSREEKEKFKEKLKTKEMEQKMKEKKEEKRLKEKLLLEINEKKKETHSKVGQNIKFPKKELTEKQKKKELEKIRIRMEEEKKERKLK